MSSELTPHEVAAEVLELGESLFDVVLNAAQTPGSEPFPAELAREAANEFFARLREIIGPELLKPPAL